LMQKEMTLLSIEWCLVRRILFDQSPSIKGAPTSRSLGDLCSVHGRLQLCSWYHSIDKGCLVFRVKFEGGLFISILIQGQLFTHKKRSSKPMSFQNVKSTSSKAENYLLLSTEPLPPFLLPPSLGTPTHTPSTQIPNSTLWIWQVSLGFNRM
jgi:hypothetical protein